MPSTVKLYPSSVRPIEIRWRQEARPTFSSLPVECECRTCSYRPYRAVPPALSTVAVVDDVFLEELRRCLPDLPTPSLDRSVAMEPLD